MHWRFQRCETTRAPQENIKGIIGVIYEALFKVLIILEVALPEHPYQVSNRHEGYYNRKDERIEIQGQKFKDRNSRIEIQGWKFEDRNSRIEIRGQKFEDSDVVITLVMLNSAFKKYIREHKKNSAECGVETAADNQMAFKFFNLIAIEIIEIVFQWIGVEKIEEKAFETFGSYYKNGIGIAINETKGFQCRVKSVSTNGQFSDATKYLCSLEKFEEVAVILSDNFDKEENSLFL
ncbi:hypothetical protein Glove_313g64 [Diversispora epigaea]|uniref:Uncharacterized protein n=1 Tax=Diversispora epigaea TaxID=1348612 RepID=A0A397HR21_9GLOM|nr:hypothetical protein Glove_313g64 [Diversispora epigaea]